MKRRGNERRDRERALRLIEDSGLPESLQERIRSVVVGSRLTGDALMDVARELLSHFEDGLAAGKTASDLLDAFGDGSMAASLIAHEKRRADPYTGDRFVVSTSPGDRLWRRVGRQVRYALRRALQSPGFTATAVLSLAIGIGANTAIFTLVNTVLLADPPYEEPDRLIELYASTPEFGLTVLSYPELRTIREEAGDVFSSVAGASLAVVQLEGEGDPQVIPAELVTGNYFQTLGLTAAVGRTLMASDEDGRTAETVVMLSHSLWQEAFGGDPAVVGRSLVVSGRPHTVVGVAPKNFAGSFRGIPPQLYAPILLRPVLEPGAGDVFEDWRNHYVFGKARLAPGATLEQAEVLMANVRRRLLELDRWQPDFTFRLIRTSDVTVFPPLDRFIKMAAVLLTAVVGLVLLIACANLAGFLLARAMDRRREIAVRLALGATRRDLVAQLATETLLLAMVGGVLGIALGSLALKALVTADLPLPMPVSIDIGLNGSVFLYGMLVSAVAGLVFGVFPALEASRTDVAATIKDEATGVGRSGGFSLRSFLVGGQVAVSFVLLIAAGLFLRSLQSTLSVDPGFGSGPAGTVLLALPQDRYGPDEARAFHTELLEAYRALPEVTAVGVASNLHLNALSTSTRSVVVDGVDPPAGRDDFEIDWSAVGPGFLDAISLPLLQGRDFSEEDDADGPPVVIVNQAFVDRFWPGDEVLGRTFRFAGREVTVVGVAATAKIRTLGEAPRPFVYAAFRQHFDTMFNVVARTRGNPQVMAQRLVSAARARDPLIWAWQPRALERHIGVMLLPTQMGAVAVSSFAFIALLLAAIGLYGVVAYSVSQRTREVGIRLSLGAEVQTVVRMLMTAGLKPVLGGAFVGMILALAGARLVSALLFGVHPFDPLAFGAVTAVFATVALGAAYVPARRASRVDPVRALRTD